MPAAGSRKRSSRVDRGSLRGTMLAAGTVGVLVVGAGLWLGDRDQPAVQDQYASLADCQADWGQAAGACEPPAAEAAGAGSRIGSVGSGLHNAGMAAPLWLGPVYPAGDREGALRQAWAGRPAPAGFVPGNRSIGRASVARGGFGSGARSASSHSSAS
jgi:hypothetical protein